MRKTTKQILLRCPQGKNSTMVVSRVKGKLKGADEVKALGVQEKRTMPGSPTMRETGDPYPTLENAQYHRKLV